MGEAFLRRRKKICNAVGHGFFGSYWSTVYSATCVESGLEERYCEKCGAQMDYSYIDIDPSNHVNTGYTTYGGSCVSKSRRCLECRDCGTTLSEEEGEYNPNSHAGPLSTSTIPPSCTVDGKETTKCKACGETVSSTTIPAPGHTYEGGKYDDGGYPVCDVCGLPLGS